MGRIPRSPEALGGRRAAVNLNSSVQAANRRSAPINTLVSGPRVMRTVARTKQRRQAREVDSPVAGASMWRTGSGSWPVRRVPMQG